MRRQLVLSIVVAVLVAVFIGGCGGSGDPLRAVLGAARSTLSQSAESDLTLHRARLFGGAPSAVVGRAEFAFRSGLGYEALDVPVRGQRAAGTAYLDFLPTKVYVDPVVRSALPAGRIWLSATFAGPGSVGARFPLLAEVLEGLNPQLLLEEIVWGAAAASALGERVIAHVPFTEYIVSIDLKRALAAARGPLAGAMRSAVRDELSALLAGHGARGSSSVRVEVWVDGPGRVARLQASLPGSKLGTVLMVLSNYGVTIPVSLPLESQVVDIASLSRVTGADAASWVFTGTR